MSAASTVEKNILEKLKARAERGDANAMYNIGRMYDCGRFRGISRDQALARIWYEKAAAKGESRAAHNLACSHRDGEGGPVDRAAAARYFRMAADMGHVQATTCLGIALMLGDGVKRDPEGARRWLRKGANAGDELAVQQLQLLDMMGAINGMANVSVSTSSSSSPGAVMFSFGG